MEDGPDDGQTQAVWRGFQGEGCSWALRGELTTSQLATKHSVHQTMVSDWKRQAMEGLPLIFAGKTEARDAAREGELEKLHAKIGQLVMERDFFGESLRGVLLTAGVRISMDGHGRWMDNVFIERLWRSLKYECVYLHAFETGSELRAGLTWWIDHYNGRRPHSSLAGGTPDEVYSSSRRR